ncbi:MAG: thiamine-phosphate kinase [Bacillota bacterium]|nr:thiamine-phosphate kinase [Bacillota bacterium]HOB88547.1 thiamine-phosphate kinase [Bacillota bacterium]HOJ57221.1 thiamine-phosphate kinase [Bacillota bacterium]HOL02786.1 thiamine-phosphate kinase [Bacillota bacterium]HPO81134.1 thiamine-phosphate kinase [Bacillota bacterium]
METEITGGEFGLIERIKRLIDAGVGDAADVVLGIGDDAAIVLPPPGKLLSACDMLVEGVHFKKEFTSPRSLGWKALAVNISDIAAMGGVPLFALVSIGLPRWADDAYVESIYEGMLDIAQLFGVKLIGGDTVSSPEAMVLNVTILGSADSPVTRGGAVPGDLIAVTGCLGRSAAGLACLKRTQQDKMSLNEERSQTSEDGGSLQDAESGANWLDELIYAHLEPVPRVSEGLALSSTGLVNAMMDISDGLAGDIHHIARESKVGAVIKEELIPICESTLRAAKMLKYDPLEWALSGGEDFELLFTFAPGSTDKIRRALSELGRTMHVIGHITAETAGVVLVDKDGVAGRIADRGFDHFRIVRSQGSESHGD